MTVPNFPSHHTTPGHTVAELLAAYTRDFLPTKAPTTQYHERLLFRWFGEELGTIPLEPHTRGVLERMIAQHLGVASEEEEMAYAHTDGP